jgi:DNA-binding NarL/FixJ family response regulator
LLDIVAIAVWAVLCGADTWIEVEAFGRAKEAWLRTFLALPHGIPSHDTFGRVFAALDPDQFEAGFRSWVAAVAQVTAGAVAIDGKTLRRSHDAAQGKTALVLVSAWAEANRLVLGQLAVEAAGGGPAAPDPLAALGLTPREIDVLRLLAHGRSNPQIGDTLFISPRTANFHVTNLLAKLELDSRAAAAAFAVRHGLA